MTRSTRKEAAELVLALASAGKDGEFILKQYAIAKDGNTELMMHAGDRQDLVADIVADLHYVDTAIEDLPGFDQLRDALVAYCDTQGFVFEDLRGRGERNAEHELGSRPRI